MISNNRAILVVTAMLVICVPLVGQTFTGTVAGTVKDTTGAVIPDVKLLLINTATNDQRAQSSKEDGSFMFALVPPGSYRLEALREDFKHFLPPALMKEVQQSPALQIGSQPIE